MTHNQMLITILIVALATIITRFLPFMIFPSHVTPPKFIQYLGTVLPASVMGLLAVYAFKNTPIMTAPYGVPELLATLLLIIVHIKKRQFLLSIAVGTIAYMILLRMLT